MVKKTSLAKKSVFLLVMLAGLGFGGCATYSTVNGIATPVGAFDSAAINVSREKSVIASYNLILGLISIGYDKFLEDTKGKDIDIIDTNYLNFFRIVKAVPKK